LGLFWRVLALAPGPLNFPLCSGSRPAKPARESLKQLFSPPFWAVFGPSLGPLGPSGPPDPPQTAFSGLRAQGAQKGPRMGPCFGAQKGPFWALLGPQAPPRRGPSFFPSLLVGALRAPTKRPQNRPKRGPFWALFGPLWASLAPPLAGFAGPDLPQAAFSLLPGFGPQKGAPKGPLFGAQKGQKGPFWAPLLGLRSAPARAPHFPPLFWGRPSWPASGRPRGPKGALLGPPWPPPARALRGPRPPMSVQSGVWAPGPKRRPKPAKNRPKGPPKGPGIATIPTELVGIVAIGPPSGGPSNPSLDANLSYSSGFHA